MDTEECDKAWEEFRENSYRIQKTAIGDKLDTLAMMLQGVKTDTERSADLIPRLLGEDAALQNAPPMDPAMMGTDPTMGGDPMMEDPSMGMESQGDAVGMPMGGEDMMNDETEQMEAPPMEGGPMPPEGEMPPMEGGPDMPMDEGMGEEITDEEIETLLNDVLGDGGEMPMDGGAGAAMGSPDVSEKAMALIAALKQAAHEAIDSGQPEQVMQWAEVENAITSALSGMVDLTLPVAGSGLEADAGESEVPVEGGLPMVDDVPEEEPAPEGDAPSEEPAPAEEGSEDSKDDAPKEESEGGSEEKETKDEGEKEEKEDDEDSEPAKKSADELTDLPEPPEEPSILDDVKPEEPKIAKSYDAEVFAVPDMRALMSNGGFSAPHQSGIGPDGLSPLIKGDDRITTARNIFETPMGSRGSKDADSIVTAHTYESATDLGGKQDPDSIVTATPITDVKKGNAPYAVPVVRMDTNDHSPLTVADQVSSPEETDDTRGEQKPEAVATAKPAVEGEGDDSEGTKTRLELPDMDEPVHKAEDNGKPIMSLQEMMALAKSDRPGFSTSVNGDITPPTLGNVKKSQTNPVRMGQGVDPYEVVKQDLENFKLHVAQTRF